MSVRWRHLTVAGALAVLTFAIYGQTLDDEFHFDDRAELAWPGVREFSPNVSTAHYRGVVPLWVWALNFRVSGEEVWSYHLLNLLIHLGNSLLVYALAWTLIGSVSRVECTTRLYFAATAALLFCAHPIATQAVSYVTQRSTSLAAGLLFGALVAYLRYRESSSPERRTAWAALCLATFFAGVYTKHVAFVLPVVVLLAEWVLPPTRRRARAWVGIWALMIVVLAARLWQLAPRLASALGQLSPSAEFAAAAGAKMPGSSVDSVSYLLTQFRVLIRYASLLVFPRGQNLDYDFPLAQSIFEPGVLVGMALCGTLIATVVVGRRCWPLASFGLGVALICLAPTSSVYPRDDVIFEHRLYASLAGACLATSAGLVLASARWGVRAREAGWTMTIVVTTLLAAATLERNQVWDKEVSLWGDTVAKSPAKVRPRVNLGLALQDRGRLGEAVGQYLRALELAPDHVVAMNNLGNIYREQGNLIAARKYLERAIELRESYVEARVNLGNVYMELNDVEAAESSYREAIRIDPAFALAWYNLGKALEAQGRHEEVVSAYESAVERSAADALLLNDLGCAYYVVRRWSEAEAVLTAATIQEKRWAVPHFNLGLVHEAREDYVAAVREFATAVALEPGLRPASEHLATALDGMGDHEEADTVRGRAGRVLPDRTGAHSTTLSENRGER